MAALPRGALVTFATVLDDAALGRPPTSIVQLVRWPDDATRRDELADAGIPRLLLVPERVPAPRLLIGLEDWIRVPADERDLFLRIDRLARRYRTPLASAPVLDDLVLRNADAWVALSPTEAAIARPLVDHFGELVLRDHLVASAWTDCVERSLNSVISDLRRRVGSVGLRLLTVRARGYLLEHELR